VPCGALKGPNGALLKSLLHFKDPIEPLLRSLSYGCCRCVQFSPCGQQLAAGGADGAVEVFAVQV
jgi:hypothetical protein